MKKLLALLLLFGIVGCATTLENAGFLDSRNTSIGCNGWSGCRHSSHEVSTKYNDVELELDYSLVAYPKAEAINLETGKKFHFGHSITPSSCILSDVAYEHCPKFFVEELCEGVFGSECVLSRFNDETYYRDLDGYRRKIEDKRIAEIKKEEEELISLEKRKQDAFNKLFNTCLGYGFNEQNVIASCIQQEIFNEKKLAILKEQQLEQLASLNSQQTEEQEETNFWLQILEGVAEGLADPNTWENARQNAEIQRLKNACRRTRSC